MKNYTQVYVKDSFAAAKTYCKAFGAEITREFFNDNHSTWAIDLNAHYVVKLSEMFGFYPLAGLSLSFWNWDAGHGLSHNETRLGANIGLGGEVYATDNLSIGLEVKYNIIKDFDQAMLGVRVGYSF